MRLTKGVRPIRYWSGRVSHCETVHRRQHPHRSAPPLVRRRPPAGGVRGSGPPCEGAAPPLAVEDRGHSVQRELPTRAEEVAGQQTVFRGLVLSDKTCTLDSEYKALKGD